MTAATLPIPLKPPPHERPMPPHAQRQHPPPPPAGPEVLVRVVGPNFCAGIVLRGMRCTEAAPILRWCIGRGRSDLRACFWWRGWVAHVVRGYPPPAGSASSAGTNQHIASR